MKKILFVLIMSFLGISSDNVKADNTVKSITTQTNLLDYVFKSSNGEKIISISPDRSTLIQDSKNEIEFKQFLLKN